MFNIEISEYHKRDPWRVWKCTPLFKEDPYRIRLWLTTEGIRDGTQITWLDRRYDSTKSMWWCIIYKRTWARSIMIAWKSLESKEPCFELNASLMKPSSHGPFFSHFTRKHICLLSHAIDCASVLLWLIPSERSFGLLYSIDGATFECP